MSQSREAPAQSTGVIRVGIGGWSYAPWHDTFYPGDLPRSKALEYASRQFSAIEVNSTFYGSQKPDTFARWRDITPDHFIFTLKAPRVATHRSDLGKSHESIARFIDSGIDRLGPKLGPLLWQFPEARQLDLKVFEHFFEGLPKTIGNQRLRHAVDVRHSSFADTAFIHLARQYQIAISFTDADGMPSIADPTSDFVYARLRCARSTLKTGYTLPSLKRWAAAAGSWSAGTIPQKFSPLAEPCAKTPRDTYLFFINGAKERAPAAALRLLTLL